MANINRPFTGYGLFASNGSRQNYSWCAIGSGPDDANPLLVEHGTITATESASIATLGTTAYNGWTDSYASTATITGTVNGYLTASDGDHSTDPASIRAGAKGYLIVTAGAWRYEGWVLISDFNITVSASEIASVSFGYTFKTAPVHRRLSFLQGGCPQP